MKNTDEERKICHEGVVINKINESDFHFSAMQTFFGTVK